MIKIKFKILLILCFTFFLSCVTHKDLEYISTDLENVDIVKDDYIIHSGDLLSVQISSTTKSDYDFFNLQETSHPQLMAQNPYLYGYLVKPDGILDLPMIGSIKANGFKISELESVIREISSTYFKDPIVKINVLNFNVTILGEVNSPGRYNIIRSDQNIFHLLGQANDLTEFANRKKVKIIRNLGDNYEDKVRIFTLDLTDPDVLKNKDYYLKSQDIIYVEPLRKKFYSVKNLSSAVSMSISAITLYFLIIQN